MLQDRRHFLKVLTGAGSGTLLLLVAGQQVFAKTAKGIRQPSLIADRSKTLKQPIQEELPAEKVLPEIRQPELINETSKGLKVRFQKELAIDKSFTFDVVSLDERAKVVFSTQKQANYFSEDLGQGIELDMVAIPGGQFIMGSPLSESKLGRARPQHQVMVEPFYLGKFPITQAQWKAIAMLPKIDTELESDPSRFKGDHRPVETVSWYDAVEFCKRLSRASGRVYRLPSEAEWEYACRAGTITPFHFGPAISRDFVNCHRNQAMGVINLFGGETTEVGYFKVANAFGLYDMHGNVTEWCQDIWHGNYKGAPTDGSARLNGRAQDKVSRGGSFNLFPIACRSASRAWGAPAERFYSYGFRVVCVTTYSDPT